MIDRNDVFAIYDAIYYGKMDKKEGAQWAYDVINNDGDFTDEVVENAVYNLVSFHDVGGIFSQYRPDDSQLAAIRDNLAGTTVPVDDDELTGNYHPDFVF